MSQLFQNVFGATPSWAVFFVRFLLIAVLLSVFNVKVSTRVQLWTAMISVAAVVIASLVTVGKGGRRD